MIKELEKQKEFFRNGKTFDINFRIDSLKKLKRSIKQNESKIIKALEEDLGKMPMESYMTEISIVYGELDNHISNLKKWNMEKNVNTPLSLLPGKSFVKNDPYGTVLIMSPWNYPFQLAMVPLIGAIGGGNTAILRPSTQSKATSEIINEVIELSFEADYVNVVGGDHSFADKLIEADFDMIFFTGSTKIGKKIMLKASENLTPVVLELGGKSPVIVDESANLEISARRIAFGKITNSGQTCVAPDYLLIDSSIYGDFVSHYQNELNKCFPRKDGAARYKQMAKMISAKQMYEKSKLMNDVTVVLGGAIFEEEQKIEPTVLDCGKISDYKEGGKYYGENCPLIMREEIFAPLLPIIRYDNLDEAIDFIKDRPKPLALYLFTSKSRVEKKITDEISYGGGCINDSIVHLANENYGFGGVGMSGMGSYHGRKSFDTFTHSKSIYKNSNKIDIKARYMPYSEKKFSLVKSLMK